MHNPQHVLYRLLFRAKQTGYQLQLHGRMATNYYTDGPTQINVGLLIIMMSEMYDTVKEACT